MALAIAIALVLSLGAWASFHAWHSERGSLARYAESTGLEGRHPRAVREILSEPDPIAARLRFARLLLADELDLRWVAELSPSERQAEFKKSLGRLALAEKIARETLRQRPASWEAAMILGGSVYLTGRRKADPNIYYDRSTWEKPLLAAHRLAPAQAEPLRFLSAALLDSWFSLSTAERQQATSWIAKSFKDQETFALLAPEWIETAPNLNDALKLVPDRLAAWSEVQNIFRSQFKWQEMAVAHARARAALPQLLRSVLTDADQHREGGDLEGARSLYLQILNSVPPGRRISDIAQAAITNLPPGPVPALALPGVLAWLKWTLNTCLLGPCPLSAAAIGRLANAVNDLPPETDALASIASGNLTHARMIEIQHGELWSEVWGPYLMLKARMLASRGDSHGAEAALGKVNWSLRDSGLFRWNKLLVSRSARDVPETARASEKLASLSANAWPASQWDDKGRDFSALLIPAIPADRIRVHLDKVPSRGGLAIIGWDGEEIGAVAVHEPGWIELPIQVAPQQLDRISLSAVTNGGHLIEPGQIQLVPSTAPHLKSPTRRPE